MTKPFVPAPPSSDPRRRRYSAATMAYAQQLRAAGWTIPQIRDLVEKQTGHRPSRTTIENWVDPSLAAAHRERSAASHRRRRAGDPSRQPPRRLTDADLLALREEDELSYQAIAKVVRRFYRVEMTEVQIRGRLLKLGISTNPKMARDRVAA